MIFFLKFNEDKKSCDLRTEREKYSNILDYLPYSIGLWPSKLPSSN